MGSLSAQTFSLPPAPPDKAVVYFVRNSSLGVVIPFDYYDSTRLVARFNGVKYFRYECEPGAHVLWAHSENRDFVNADLEAGKTYLIEVIPTMGIAMAEVTLNPLDPANPAHAKRITRLLKFMAKKAPLVLSPEKLEEWNAGTAKSVGPAGMKRYAELSAEKSRRIAILSKTMHYPR